MAEKASAEPRGVRGWRGTAVEIVIWSIIGVMVGWSVSTIYSEIQLFHPASHWTLQLAFAIAFAMSNALCAYLYVVYPGGSATRRASAWGVVLFGVGSAAVQTHYYVNAELAIVPAIVMGSIGPLAEGFLAVMSGYMQQDAVVQQPVPVAKSAQAPVHKAAQPIVQPAEPAIVQDVVQQPAIAQESATMRRLNEAQAACIAEGVKPTNAELVRRTGLHRNTVGTHMKTVTVSANAAAS